LAARRHVVEAFAHGAGRMGGRTIQQRVGATRRAEIRAARLDAIALAGNAEFVERIAQSGGIEPACTFNVGIFFAHLSFSAYVRKHRPSPRRSRRRPVKPWPWPPRARRWPPRLPAPVRHPPRR